jgi:hypothetical protein
MAYAYPINNQTTEKRQSKFVWNYKTNGYEQTSGPAELKNPNKIKNNCKYYCLDLINKYHNNSAFKSFHTVTFWLRNGTKDNKLDPNYKETIIRAQVPNSFTYSIGGEYGPPSKSDIAGGSIGLIGTLFSSESMASAYDTTRIWQKPKSLQIKLDIPIFDDVDSNSGINLQEALAAFGRVILPGGTNSWTSLYSITPGPATIEAKQSGDTNGEDKETWLETAQKWGASFLGSKTGLHRVTIQIGGMLLLDWAVITDMTVTYPNTKQQVLHNWYDSSENGAHRKFQLLPQTAVISLTIETVAGLTVGVYDKMLNLETNEIYNDDDKQVDQKKVEPAGMCDITGSIPDNAVRGAMIGNALGPLGAGIGALTGSIIG